MKKVWIFEKKGHRSPYGVGWYENRQKRSKYFTKKSLANDFKAHKWATLNSDSYTSPVSKPWDELVSEYLKYKENVQSLSFESLRSIRITLENFKALHGPNDSTRIDQRHIDDFIAHRLTKVSKATVNKDIRNLKTFVRWSARNHYMGHKAKQFHWVTQKEIQKRFKSLNHKQISNLLIAAKSYQCYGDAWYIRILLAITTGLRKNDIERLKISDIDVEQNTIDTFSKKTGKGMNDRPLHESVAPILINYIDTLPVGQVSLFTDRHTSGKWDKIRKQAKLPKLTYHDLRKNFGSLIQQQGHTLSVVQDLLEHSTPAVTKKTYTDLTPVFRDAVNSIPLDKIL